MPSGLVLGKVPHSEGSLLVYPGNIASFYGARMSDFTKDRYTMCYTIFFNSPGSATRCVFPHITKKNQTMICGDHRIPAIDRVQGHRLMVWKDMDFFNRFGQMDWKESYSDTASRDQGTLKN